MTEQALRQNPLARDVVFEEGSMQHDTGIDGTLVPLSKSEHDTDIWRLTSPSAQPVRGRIDSRFSLPLSVISQSPKDVNVPGNIRQEFNGQEIECNTKSLAASFKYDSTTTSLREYLRRVASFKTTFGLRFRRQDRLLCDGGGLLSGLDIVRDLQVLETIYQPFNIISPPAALLPVLCTLQLTLKDIKRKLEREYWELLRRGRKNHVGEFLGWVYQRYQLPGKPPKTCKALLRSNSDSLRVNCRDIESAIAYFGCDDALNDGGKIGIFAPSIVHVLERHLADLQKNNLVKGKKALQWLQRLAGMDESGGELQKPTLRSPKSCDRLVFAFPEANQAFAPGDQTAGQQSVSRNRRVRNAWSN